ncbi:hypothetical protein GEMRC1_011718 [Eukaryota sp. GEM-RC1]
MLQQKKFISTQLEQLFCPAVRIVTLSQDPKAMSNVVRFLRDTKVTQFNWRQNRSYLLCDSMSRDESNHLVLTGYVRGAPLCADQLFSIVEGGDYVIESIKTEVDPLLMKFSECDEMSVEISRNPTKCDSLTFVRPVDWTAGEQSLITEEELNSAPTTIVKAPKGYSSYQACWINADHSDDESDQSDCDDDVDGLIELGLQAGDDVPELTQHVETMCDQSIDNDDDVFSGDDQPEEEVMFKPRRDDELEFPEEVDTDPSISAEIEFKNFRGLQSLRTSPWDPKENLPKNYSRIFAVNDYKVLSKKLSKLNRINTEDNIDIGSYVSVKLVNVPQNLEENYSALGRCPIGVNLLKNEGKMTMVHLLVRVEGEKDEVLFSSSTEIALRFGFRKMIIHPLFSEKMAGCSKLKYSKKIYGGRSYVMSFYGPLLFNPLPFLVYHQSNFIGSGSIYSCDPDLIILQKIILTGYPVKIHKSTATVRYMFFNRSDIMYFAPVGLWTKNGLSGSILGPVGTHGIMKCRFSGIIKNSDTVCMSLFKRVFPTFNSQVVSCVAEPLNMEADVVEEDYHPYERVV